MSSDFAIRVHNLSKNYQIYEKPRDRLKQMLLGGHKKFYQDFTALKNVSFDVRKAETLGVIGRNGSGKSTLLQVICGILTPTSGAFATNGRIAALLELGTGFNPEFTGRENVYMSAAIMGLSKDEIDERYKLIVEFADIGDFVEHTVKTYSAGMYVRLAFATAINMDPDILVIDEALAVGDVKFQSKCFRKFEELQKAGKTILFVSHSVEQIVRHCDRALLLDQGGVVALSEPKKVVNLYMDLLFGKDETTAVNKNKADQDDRSSRPLQKVKDATHNIFFNHDEIGERFHLRRGYNEHEYRWGDRGAEVIDYLLFSRNIYDVTEVSSLDELTLHLKIRFNRNVARPVYGITLKTPDGLTIYGNNSRDWNGEGTFGPQEKGNVTFVSFSFTLKINTGDYFISVGVAEDKDGEIVPLDRRYDSIYLYVIGRQNCGYGIVDLGMRFEQEGHVHKS